PSPPTVRTTEVMDRPPVSDTKGRSARTSTTTAMGAAAGPEVGAATEATEATEAPVATEPAGPTQAAEPTPTGDPATRAPVTAARATGTTTTVAGTTVTPARPAPRNSG